MLDRSKRLELAESRHACQSLNELVTRVFTARPWGLLTAFDLARRGEGQQKRVNHAHVLMQHPCSDIDYR